MSTGVPGFLFRAERSVSMIESIHDSSAAFWPGFWRSITPIITYKLKYSNKSMKKVGGKERRYCHNNTKSCAVSTSFLLGTMLRQKIIILVFEKL
mmetsp:Transcript_7292/g.10603  ORF Transcript_7292/g.10603 Transcript_7292/m.10603 type:complete len:95 (-) Transcript_7292:1-285(-)